LTCPKALPFRRRSHLRLLQLLFQLLALFRCLRPLKAKGNVKDVQGILGHTKADTIVNIYMQPIALS
jgi:hypothetical protein